MQIVPDIFSMGITPNDKVLAIFPHPDDESVYAGGFMRLLSVNGVSAQLIMLTKGEKSTLRFGLRETENLAEVRIKELHTALNRLGIDTYDVADFPDGGLVGIKDDLKHYLSQHVGKYQPTILLTLEPSGIYGHPDHIAVAEVVRDIGKSFSVKVLFVTVKGELYNPSAAARQMAHETHRFDPLIPEYRLMLDEEVAAVKLKAISAHGSQHIVDEEFLNKWRKRELLQSEFFTYDAK